MKQKEKATIAKKTIATAAVLIAAAIAGTAFYLGLHQKNNKMPTEEGKSDLTLEVGLDKARYAPGEEAIVSVEVTNQARKPAGDLRLELEAYYLGDSVEKEE